MTQDLAPEMQERPLRMQATGKAGTPCDIAHAVSFLASDAAQFITGQILYVDGGRSCGVLPL